MPSPAVTESNRRVTHAESGEYIRSLDEIPDDYRVWCVECGSYYDRDEIYERGGRDDVTCPCDHWQLRLQKPVERRYNRMAEMTAVYGETNVSDYGHLPRKLRRHAKKLGFDGHVVGVISVLNEYQENVDSVICPSQETIADLVPCSVREVRRILDWLCDELRLIIRTPKNPTRMVNKGNPYCYDLRPLWQLIDRLPKASDASIDGIKGVPGSTYIEWKRSRKVDSGSTERQREATPQGQVNNEEPFTCVKVADAIRANIAHGSVSTGQLNLDEAHLKAVA